MPIHKFEVFHGAVFTRLLRKEKPVMICELERNLTDGWGAYRINDMCALYVKYRTKPKDKDDEYLSSQWDFTFSKNERQIIKEFLVGKEDEDGNNDESNILNVYIALVCGRVTVSPQKDNMHFCFLTHDQLLKCIELEGSGTETVHVIHRLKHSLRVHGAYNKSEPLLIHQNALDKWEVPEF